MFVDVNQNIWDLGNAEGAGNREWLAHRKIWALNLMGSPGAGKTALLECVVPLLAGTVRVGVIEGDVATSRDAERIARLGVPVVQLEIGGVCHLDGRMVRQGLDALGTVDLDAVIIENVGNLVCPADFDLGENIRLAVLSTVEGEDKIVKYPTMFRRVDALVITKFDLLEHTPFSIDEALREFATWGPTRPVFATAVPTGAGMASLAQWIVEQIRQFRQPPTGADRHV